jgi:hypothetical protein
VSEIADVVSRVFLCNSCHHPSILKPTSGSLLTSLNVFDHLPNEVVDLSSWSDLDNLCALSGENAFSWLTDLRCADLASNIVFQAESYTFTGDVQVLGLIASRVG